MQLDDTPYTSRFIYILPNYQSTLLISLFHFLLPISKFVFLLNLSETTMKLDSMVGDIEDAVSSAINKNLRKHSPAQSSEVRIFPTLCVKDNPL